MTDKITPNFFIANEANLSVVASNVADIILESHNKKPIDCILFGEHHDSLSDKVVQSLLIDNLSHSIDIRFYGIEWPEQDSTSKHFITDVPRFLDYNLNNPKYSWVSEYKDYISEDKTAIPLARLLSIQAAAQGLAVETIDCGRECRYNRMTDGYEWRITDKNLPPSVINTIEDNEMLRAISQKLPSFYNLYGLLAGSEHGMIIRDLMIADKLVVKQDQVQGALAMATVGLSHILDVRYPERPTLPDVLTTMGKNVFSVTFPQKEDSDTIKQKHADNVITVALPIISVATGSELSRFYELVVSS